jgi:hypothetical protein
MTARRRPHGISTQERYRALLVIENLDAISAWRASREQPYGGNGGREDN